MSRLAQALLAGAFVSACSFKSPILYDPDAAAGAGGNASAGGDASGGKTQSVGGSANGGATGGNESVAGSESGGAAGSGSGDADSGGFGGATDFPSTAILDDFNRLNGDPGLNWIGSEFYSIAGEQLSCVNNCFQPALWATSFGENQEVFATLSQFNALTTEINLVLKAQDSPNCELIEVLYSPSEQQARTAYCVQQQYTDLGHTSVELSPGDTFGGRAYADGRVEIYVNDERIATVDVSEYPHSTGRIGVNGLASSVANQWDDFGGGDFEP